MKRKLKIFVFIVGITLFSACNTLDVPPMNIVQDNDLFQSPDNVKLYLARLYNYMPIQDFKYSIRSGFNDHNIQAYSAETGEALSKQSDGYADEFYGKSSGDFWNAQYKQIRQVNYFMETLPAYTSNFTKSELDTWIAEAYFIRAYSYFALVKRFGGVPILTKSLEITGGAPESYAQARNSEEEVWNLVAADLDIAINGLPEKSEKGRANKYVAAALKSRAMLHAASIAKYNQITMFDGSVRLQGMPAEKAAYYFQAAYAASQMLDGKYSLYKAKWKSGDKAAQQENFKQLFLDNNSTENIFVKDYYYPNAVHSYDAFMVPRQFQGSDGYSSFLNPTLDFVEMFDGIPKDENGRITGLNKGNSTYVMFDDPYDLYKNAEPRLLATVMVPGSQFRSQKIDIRAGIYTGQISNGSLAKLTNANDFLPYTDLGGKLKITKIGSNPLVVAMPDGSTMSASGACGPFLDDSSGALTGFTLRKYLNENMSDPKINMSTQSYIDFRYAEVLLNKAEAAFELGKIDDAYNAIVQIQERAGANVTLKSDFNLEVIRKERRKELAFENNTYFDLKRWRVMQVEMSDRYYFGLFPILSSQTGKYFFDKKAVNRKYNMKEVKNYYLSIPGGAMEKNGLLKQNFGY